MNKKYEFIKLIKQIDDFYLEYPIDKELMDEYLEEYKYKTYKEYFKKKRKNYLSDVDVNSISHIINQDIKDKNPFRYFYYLDDEIIKKIFYLLAYTHKAIKYFNDYSISVRTYQENKSVTANKNAIKKVLELVHNTDKKSITEYLNSPDKYNYNDIPIGYKVIEYLKGLEQTLSNKHYTKQNIFQNLYFELYEILNKQKYYNTYSEKNEEFTKSLIVRIVNQLIENYFSEDNSFTTTTDLTSYVKVKYNYETFAGITLTHKPTKKSKV